MVELMDEMVDELVWQRTGRNFGWASCSDAAKAAFVANVLNTLHSV